MSILLKSCNNNNIMNTSTTNNFDIEIKNLRGIKSNKYSNDSIFTKRDIGFNKSLEKNKTTFKYRKYHSYFEITKNNKNENNRNNIKKNNLSNSLYLTDYIFNNKSKNKFNNNNNSSIHSFRKSRSHFFESDKSIFTNMTNNTSRKYHTNNISNNYISFCKGQIFPSKSLFLTNSNKNKNNHKKINLKLYNPRYLLNTFETEKENDKRNKRIKIELEYNHLYKKRYYINYERKKGFDRHKYLEAFNDYLIEKTHLENLKEKKNRLKEENNYKLNLANDSVNETRKAYEAFNEVYFVKYDKFIKKQKFKSKDERIKCDKYIEYIFELKKEINSLIVKINKTKINIDYLNKFALLNAKIHLKKISLPIYYEYIFENKKSELNKFNLSEQDIQNILKYKKNINLNKMLSLLVNYENDDLNLLNEYNYLLNDINVLKKRKKDFINDLKHKNNDNDIPESIISSQNELDKLKEKYQELINTKHILLSNDAIENISNKNKKKSNKNVRKSSIIINYNELYFKTIKIFNNLNDYINHNLDYIKKPKFVEDVQDLIKYNFEKIEVLANILLERINKFKQDNPQKAKIFKEMMDQKRKMRNDLEQRKNYELLIKLKKEKIDAKNKKALSIKRSNIYNYNLMAKYKKRNKPKKLIKTDSIFDYIIP